MSPIAGILIETEKSRIKPGVTAMFDMVHKSDFPFIAILPGKINSENETWLSRYGCKEILTLPLLNPENLNPVDLSLYLKDILEASRITHFLGLSTPLGKDILPRVASIMDSPLVMDCTAVDLNTHTASTSQYSGKTVGHFKLTGPVNFFGIRPIPQDLTPVRVTPNIKEWELNIPESDQLRPIKKITTADTDRIPLSEAQIIVSGGRGMKQKENFKLLHDLAEKLDAAVGSSRVPVDFGWVPYAMQVGQTGEKVSPAVYISCGISGSVQHFAGMKSSNMIIAINEDEKAFISTNCDYYVKADVLELIPELIKLLHQE